MLISFVKARFEDGAWSGVPRFDWELRKVFPDMVSLNAHFLSSLRLWYLCCRYPKLVVITTSELSLRVPSWIKTIVVLHGCAQTHFDRDIYWRGRLPKQFCDAQRKMYQQPNRWYVAPSKWVATEFSRHYGVPLATVIPHWVAPIIKEAVPVHEKPIILGDWRDFNKGKTVIQQLEEACPEWRFVTLSCTYDTRTCCYEEATVYLCLSLSEGGSYSVSDAEAAGLPIVTTDVGNYLEYTCEVISWETRHDLKTLKAAIDRAIHSQKTRQFFDTWTFDNWLNTWKGYVDHVKAC